MNGVCPVLIVGISARGLVQAARRCGFEPYAADFYADLDLRSEAAGWRRLSGPVGQGIQQDCLLEALSELEAMAGGDFAGVVCGAGFEDRPHLLDILSSRWPLIGNGSEAITAVKDPEIFFGRLKTLGVPFPAYQLERPDNLRGWLFKKRGGAGGEHIVSASSHVAAMSENGQGYYQAHVDGVAVSALAVGNGQKVEILGLTQQWASPTADLPMRWAGAMRPAQICTSMAERMKRVSRKIVAAFELKGLNSVDYLVDGDCFYVLEVNPRPGATLDLFDRGTGRLFSMHAAACRGHMPKKIPCYSGACASMVVYANCDIVIPDAFRWPEGTSDLPAPGEVIGAGAPVCTVFTQCVDDARQAKKLAARFAAEILCAIEAVQ